MNVAHYSRALRLAAALAIVALGVPPPLGAQALTPLTVGTLSSDNSAAVYYAQELGLFKKYGLDVHISALASGPVTAAAVTGGALDIGVANVATIAVARTRGVPLKFLFPASIAGEGTLTDQIAVAKDSPIKTAADLNGKTIGVNGLRDLQQLCAMAWMDKHGGDSKTVQFIEVPIPQMGKVDPAVVTTMNRATYGTDLDPALMQPVIDSALKYGILSRPVPVTDLIWRAPK